MAKSTIYRPNDTVLISGIYAEIDRNNRRTGRRVTWTEGESFPPTLQPGYGYILDEITNP